MDANKITSFTVGRFEGDLPISVLDPGSMPITDWPG
jgi:hypothetical protein